MEAEFNSQESEFQETDNQLGNEEGQIDGSGSWDNETPEEVDQLEDKEESDSDGSEDTGYSEEGQENTDHEDSTEDSDDEQDVQKNTPGENSHRILSFEDYFKN